MRLLITGTPGTGKTTLAKGLAKKLKMVVINEKDFALKHSIGAFNDENELEIPIKEFEKQANKFLSKKDNVIFEGHTICEMKLKVDKVLLIRIEPEVLEARLEARNYSMEKIMDNTFCEGIDYCRKHLLRTYPASKIIEIHSKNRLEDTLDEALLKIK